MGFVLLAYSIDGTGPSIVIKYPQEDFFRISFCIYIGGDGVS